MVTFKRLMLWFTLASGLLVYLVLAGKMGERERMILVAFLFLLGIFLMGTGGGRKVKRVRRVSEASRPEPEAEEDAVDLPAPVSAEEDTSTKRDQKLARARKGETLPVVAAPEEEVAVVLADDEVAVTVIDENVHTAEEYVAEIDAESMEEADIEAFIDDRRDRHALIRRRIEARRREQLAEIRSETAKIYQSADESEDIMALLATEGHGQTVIEESLPAEAHNAVGAVFARIDETRILKVRIPLDEGFIASKEPLPALPPLPDLGGMPPPPLPGSADLPPLPPLPSLSKLDAMREEIGS